MKPTNLFALLLLLAFSSASFSQSKDAGPQVRLETVNGRTVYRSGEPIYLNLVFNSGGGEYNLLLSSEQMASNPDEFFVTPTEGVFNWRARYERGKYFMNDYFGYTKLAEKPINVDLALNDFYRFDKPGKYSVYVKTKRVFSPISKTNSPYGGDLIPLISNTIDLEIKEMTEAEEQAEIKRLSAAIDNNRNWQVQDKAARDLSFLAGDAATAEKVRRFLNPEDYRGNYQHHIRKGLLMARNKKLAVELLEKAFRDLNREVEYNLPQILGELGRLIENPDSTPPDQNDANAHWADKRSSEITQTYFDEMLRSLSLRTGKSRLITAYTIFVQVANSGPSSEAFEITREILLEGFDDLSPHGKDMLLGHFWEKFKSPVLQPSIEKVLRSGEPVSYWSYRNLALKRLLEFDPAKARPMVIEEIHNPDSRISDEVLVALDDEFLPEVNKVLLEQIRKLAATKDHRLRQKITLAARYADDTIYQELMKIYLAHGTQWQNDARIGILRYFIRHNEKDGIELIEKSMVESGDKSGSSIFYHLTRPDFPNVPDGLESIWRKRLEYDDPESAGTAAYYLSRYGDRDNKKLIEKRHAKWLKKWAGKEAELDDPNAEPKIAAEAMFQVNVIEALMNAKNWKLSPAELARVKSRCVAQKCGSHFQVR